MPRPKIELPGGARLLGEPQQQAFVLDHPDGSRQLLPIVMAGLLSDHAMHALAQMVREMIAQELDARGLTLIAKPKAS